LHPKPSLVANSYSCKPTSEQDAPSSGIIPPWASLPYEILVLIFQYASNPLYDERTFEPSASVDWLLKTSRLCRAFTEPALTVLYRSPPLVPMDRAHKLRQLLVADPEPMSYNYRAKVERLQMEVSQTAAYTLPGSGLLDMYGLIYHCPRLLGLELYHQKDFSPYRGLDDSIKWTYPDSLFIALNCNVSGVPTVLRSWRWSSRLAGKKRPIESLLDIHQSPSFSGLRKIAFVNYQKVWVRKNAEDPRHEKLLADTLNVLSGLEHLAFESSTLVNSILLPLLPINLKHLEIINCSEVDSDDLAVFLISHGSQLRTLTLNHNISLNLSFLTVLGSSCPHLESLRMNLTYYNAHSSYRDSDPGYERLLAVNEKPHWPATLRTIELTQLRRWDIDTAKMFFQSILESADTLVNLRRLVIKAILNTSWRDRSSFRDEWVGAFERVFKGHFDPPNPHLRSLSAYAAYKKQNDEVSRLNLDDSDDDISHRPMKNRRLTTSDDGSRVQLRTERTLRSAPTWDRIPSLVQNHSREEGLDKDNQQIQLPITRRSTRQTAIKSDIDEYQVRQNSRAGNELNREHPSASAGPETSHPSLRESKRKQVINRELEILRKTAGADRPPQDIYNGASGHDAGSDYNSDSDYVPLATRRNVPNGKKSEHIQGMCDAVSITIDNLRPTETQFVEADFLDSEPEGDEDWDGTEELPGDGRYAW
jgi:hypothetical protein